MFWVGGHTFLKYIHTEATKNLYCLVQWEAKKAYVLIEWTHLLNFQLPNATMVMLELMIFLIPWKILLLNLFFVSLLCWLRTGKLCHEKFLVGTKMQRASLLYFLGSEPFLLYYEISLTHFKSMFNFYTHRKHCKARDFLCFQVVQKW